MGDETPLRLGDPLDILIRPAVLDDVRQLAEIHVQGWRDAYVGLLPQEVLDRPTVPEREGQWRGAIGRTGGASWTLVGARQGGPVVGFVHAIKTRPSIFGASARIVALYVRLEEQRTGIGTALTRRIAETMAAAEIGEVRLWCLWNNATTRQFYDRLGGRVVCASVETTRGFRTILVGYSWRAASDLAQ